MAQLWLVSLLWAFSFGLIKHYLPGVDAAWLAFLRLGISLLVFLPFFRLRGLPARPLAGLFFTGMLQFGVMYVAYLAAFRVLQAYEVALFTVFTPVYVTLFDDALDRRLRRRNLAAAALATAGAAIMVYAGLDRAGLLWGFLLVQISNLAFAAGQILYCRLARRLPAVPEQRLIVVLYAGGAAVTGAFALLAGGDAPMLGTEQWLVLLYLGAIASGAGFFLWNAGARRVSTGRLAVMNNMKIPLAVVAALLVFGEKAPLLQLVLGGILLAGALLLLWPPDKANGR